MAKKLTPTQKRSLELASLFRNTDWSDDPSVLAYKREQADKIAAAEELAKSQRFANVQSRVTSTEPEPIDGFLNNVGANIGGLVDRAQGGLQSLASGYAQSAADADELAAVEEEKPWYRRDFVSPLASQADAAVLGLFSDDLQGTSDTLQSKAQANMAAADAASTQANAYSRQLTDRVPLVGGAMESTFNTMNRAVGDVVSSPDSLASVFGGGVGVTVGAAGEYYRDYGEARRSGLDVAEARDYAGTQASVVAATSFLPSERFASAPVNALAKRVSGRGLSDVVKSDAAKVAGRVVGGAAGEGLQEGTQYLAQLGVNKLISETDDGDVGRHADDQLPKNIWDLIDNTWRNTLAGAVGGGAIHTPMAGVQVAIERGKLADEALASQNKTLENLTAARERGAQIDFENQQADRAATSRTQGEIDFNAFEEEQGLLNQGRNELEVAIGTRNPAEAFARMPVSEGAARQPVVTPAADAVAAEAARTAESVVNRQKTVDTINKSDAKALGAAKTKRNADLRKHLTDTLKTVQGMPDADRADVLSAARSEWLATNPEPTLEAIKSAPPATKKNVKPTASKTAVVTTVAPVIDEATMRELVPDATPEEVAAATQSSAERLEQLRTQAKNPMPAVVGRDTGGTVDTVMNGIVSKLRGGDAKVAAKLIADKNAVIVPDASYVPGNADPRGSGFYDGERTYIVANKIDPDNVVGDVLHILSHEIKHAADVGGKKLPPSIQDFVGKKANDQLNTKIRALANTTDPLAFAAKNAVEYADASENPNLELSAAFINGARDVQNAKGAGARLLNNLVSSVRTGAKRILPGDTDINLNDVAYLSQKLMEETAISGERLKGDVKNPLPMIYSDSAPGFAQAETENRVYESVDGRKKFVLPDSGATLKPEVASLKDGDVTFLGDVLDHPVLFEQFPEAANIPIAVAAQPGSQFAKYSLTNKDIEVDPALLTGKTPAGVSLKAAVLHEVQHWVQDKGGQQDNFFVGEQAVRTQEERDAEATYETAAAARQKAARRILDNIMPAINAVRNPDTKRAMLNTLHDMDMEDRDKAGQIVSMLEDVDSVPNSLDPLIETFRARSGDATLAATPYNNLKRAREKRYLANLSEREAFSTQDNVDNPNPPVNPETEFTKGPITNRAAEVIGQAPVQSAPLPMIMSSRAKERIKKSRFAQAVVAQLRYHSGLGEKLFDSLITSKGEAGIYAQHGERAGAAIDRGIAAFAKSKGITERVAKDQVEALMSKIAKLPSPDLRRRALAHAAANDPSLAALEEAHSDIAHLTEQLVVNLLRATPNPTAKDMEFYTDLLDNTYGYTTRIFSSTQGKAGTAYSKQLWKDFEDAKDRFKAKKSATRSQIDAMNRVQNAVDYMAEHELSIPSDEEIDSMKDGKMEYLYNQWVGNFDNDYSNLIADAQRQGAEEPEAVAAARQAMVDKLAEVRDANDTVALQDKARDAVRELIGLNKGTRTLPAGMKRGPADKGILKKRTDMPDELRAVMGEITDPATLVAITMAKQGELVSRQKFLNDLRDNYNGTWVVPPTSSSQDTFTETLEGEQWGALNGWKARPEIVSTIGDMMTMYNSLGDIAAQGFAGVYSPKNEFVAGALNKLRTLAGATKIGSVILEPFGVMMNAGGSFGILATNGVINPKHIMTAGRVSWDSVINNVLDQQGKLTPAAERAIKYGVLESVRVNELKTSSHAHILRKVNERVPLGPTRNRISTSGRIAKNTVVDVFAQSDTWPKVAAFEDRIQTLTDYYKAEGVTKSESQIAQEAATHVKRTNISSDRVPPFLKTLESYGLTTFMPYFYSVPRALTQSAWIGANDIKRAFTEAKTPKGRLLMGWDGMKRMAGSGAATYGLVTLTRGIADILNGDDDEKVEALAKIMAPESRFGDPVWLGDDENDIPVFFRASRLDPYGPLNDQIRILLDPDSTWEDMKAPVMESMTGMIFANRFTGLVADAASSILGGGDTYRKDTRLGRILPSSVATVRDMGDSLGHGGTVAGETAVRGVDTLSPGWLDALDPNNKNVVPNEKGGEQLGGLIIGSGGRLDRADPSARAYRLGSEIDEARKAGAKAVDEARRAGKSEDYIMNLAARTDDNVYNYMRQLSDLYQGMTTGMDMSKRKAMALLQEDGSLDSKDVAMLARGEVPRDKSQLALNELGRAISQRSMEGQARVKDRNKTLTEKKAELKAIKEFKKKLRERGVKVED